MAARITSSTHAWSLGIYVLFVIIGSMWATGSASNKAVGEFWWPGALQAMGLLVLLSALLAFLSAGISPLLPRPTVAMWGELIAGLGLAIGFGMYWLVAFTSGDGVLIQWLAGAFALIPLLRSIQLGAELRRIRR